MVGFVEVNEIGSLNLWVPAGLVGKISSVETRDLGFEPHSHGYGGNLSTGNANA